MEISKNERKTGCNRGKERNGSAKLVFYPKYAKNYQNVKKII